MAAGAEEIYTTVSFIRDGRVGEAVQHVRQLLHSAPDVVAQWFIVSTLLRDNALQEEAPQVEQHLRRECGTSSALAYRAAMKALETTLAPEPSQPAIARRLRSFLDRLDAHPQTPDAVAPAMVPSGPGSMGYSGQAARLEGFLRQINAPAPQAGSSPLPDRYRYHGPAPMALAVRVRRVRIAALEQHLDQLDQATGPWGRG
jgi:hypothetical protein